MKFSDGIRQTAKEIAEKYERDLITLKKAIIDERENLAIEVEELENNLETVNKVMEETAKELECECDNEVILETIYNLKKENEKNAYYKEYTETHIEMFKTLKKELGVKEHDLISTKAVISEIKVLKDYENMYKNEKHRLAVQHCHDDQEEKRFNDFKTLEKHLGIDNQEDYSLINIMNTFDNLKKENEELKENREHLHNAQDAMHDYLKIFGIDNKNPEQDSFYDCKKILEQHKQKADKYDNMHKFSKDIDELIKHKNKSDNPNEFFIGDTEGAQIFKEDDAISFNGEKFIYFENAELIDNREHFEETQQPHYFDFDYDKLKKLYDKGCIIKNTDFKNDINKYEKVAENDIFGEEAMNLQEYKNAWSAHKDGKQLTEKQIEEILNEKS